MVIINTSRTAYHYTSFTQAYGVHFTKPFSSLLNGCFNQAGLGMIYHFISQNGILSLPVKAHGSYSLSVLVNRLQRIRHINRYTRIRIPVRSDYDHPCLLAIQKTNIGQLIPVSRTLLDCFRKGYRKPPAPGSSFLVNEHYPISCFGNTTSLASPTRFELLTYVLKV